MSRLISERRGPLSRLTGGDWGERSLLAEREHGASPSVNWLVAGAVVVGIGVLTWAYLGPDLRRYLKIHNM